MNRIDKINSIKNFSRLFVFACVFLILFSFKINAQETDLPEEIRGYKVERVKITIKNQNDRTDTKDDSEAFVKVGDPELKSVSLTGITFELPAEINALQASGTVDFLTFRDFRVNNLKVEIEEYKHSFDFKKNQSIVLPEPISIFLSTSQTLRGALNEMKESKNEWTVTGRIFVFGQFKKVGFKFKRVVPIEINLKIKNPARAEMQGR